MEKNHYGDTILGLVATEDLVEGRMVCLTSHSENNNFGSMTDVAGAKLPTSQAEAARARYVVAFAQDNRSLPIYQPQPHYDWALRDGWEQATNVPFNATVLLTHPGVQVGQTIPSGSLAVGYGEGEYTIPSGSYVYAADVEIPGTQLEVAYAGADKGKLTVLSAGSAVAEVTRFHTDGRLQFKVLH